MTVQPPVPSGIVSLTPTQVRAQIARMGWTGEALAASQVEPVAAEGASPRSAMLCEAVGARPAEPGPSPLTLPGYVTTDMLIEADRRAKEARGAEVSGTGAGAVEAPKVGRGAHSATPFLPETGGVLAELTPSLPSEGGAVTPPPPARPSARRQAAPKGHAERRTVRLNKPDHRPVAERRSAVEALLVKGLSDREIARQARVSPSTVAAVRKALETARFGA